MARRKDISADKRGKKPSAKRKPAREQAAPAKPRAPKRRVTFDDSKIGVDGLTDKQRAWCEHYVTCWNATEAARRAHYKSAEQSGYVNSKKVECRTYIDQRLKEITLGANEVLALLSAEAHNEASRYVVVQRGRAGVDVAAIIRDGKQHLIKGITYTRSGEPVIEFYDALAAQVHLGRYHKLFTDKYEVDDSAYRDYQEGLKKFLAKSEPPHSQGSPEGGQS